MVHHNTVSLDKLVEMAWLEILTKYAIGEECDFLVSFIDIINIYILPNRINFLKCSFWALTKACIHVFVLRNPLKEGLSLNSLFWSFEWFLRFFLKFLFSFQVGKDKSLRVKVIKVHPLENPEGEMGEKKLEGACDSPSSDKENASQENQRKDPPLREEENRRERESMY